MLLIIMIFLKSSIIEMLSMHSQDTDIFRQKRCWVRKCNACSHMRTAGNQAASYDFHFQELHEGFLSRLSYFSEQNYRNGIKLLCTRLFCSYMWVIFDNLIKRMWTLIYGESHHLVFNNLYHKHSMIHLLTYCKIRYFKQNSNSLHISLIIYVRLLYSFYVYTFHTECGEFWNTVIKHYSSDLYVLAPKDYFILMYVYSLNWNAFSIVKGIQELDPCIFR